MKTTTFFLSVLLISICTYTSAQSKSSRWSQMEYYFQNRLFHEGMGNQTFSVKIDIGFGANKKLSLLDNLDLEIGLSANYGSFESAEEEVLFISSFKSSDIHYFSHNAVNQLNLEVPIGVQLKLLKLDQSNIHLTFGAIPQIGILAKHIGINWDQNTTIISTFLNSKDPFRNIPLLSDFYLRTGLSYSFVKTKFSVGLGSEYSIFGKSIGLYSRLGYSF